MTTLSTKSILTLTCNNLRAECKKANLPTDGLKADLQQRLIDHQNNNEKTADLQGNKENNSPAPKKKFDPSDLRCPITLVLPWDPVTAEDGRVYERWAIEEHFKTQRVALKSPMTNAPMGDRLLPALQHKNLIEALIQSGVLKGDLASKWNEKVKEKKAMEDLLKKADSGDAQAMYDVAWNYRYGEDGFEKDVKVAHPFFVKAHNAGHVTATTMVALYCAESEDPDRQCRALMLLGSAACKGSRLAALALAVVFALKEAEDGTEIDKQEAIRLLRMVVENKCAVDDIEPEKVKEAQEMLDELTAAAADDSD